MVVVIILFSIPFFIILHLIIAGKIRNRDMEDALTYYEALLNRDNPEKK